MARRRGLIFDFESQNQGLRAYAFASHFWTVPDLAHTSVRTRRSPVSSIADLPQKIFVLLSFGRLRLSPTDLTVYVHPFLTNRLMYDHEQNDTLFSKRILVLRSDDVGSDTRNFPLYAVPATAVLCNPSKNQAQHEEFQTQGTKRKNLTRWQPLYMQPGETIDSYRFDDIYELIGILHAACESSEKTQKLGSRDISTCTQASLLDRIRTGGYWENEH